MEARDPTTVLLCFDDPESYRALLAPRHPEVEFLPCKGGEELEALGAGARGAEVLFGWRFPLSMVAKLPRLRWMHLARAGVEKELSAPALRAETQITCARGMHRVQMPEYAIGALLAITRGFPAMVRNQLQRRWVRMEGDNLHGKTLGILGVGAVGGEVARLARAFGVRVVGVRRSGEPHPFVDRMYGPGEMESALAQSDFVMVLLPYTAATRGFFGTERLRQMKRGAYLLCMARGGLVDEEALAEALRSGHLAGAALDVFEQEPLPPESPLWEVPNLFITPHVGGLSKERVRQACENFLENLDRFLAGQPLRNVVDRELGY